MTVHLRLITSPLLGLFILLIASPSQSRQTLEQQASIDWQAWSPEVFAQAEKEGKLVLLDLMAEGCVFCKKMDRITYRDQKVIETINNNYIAVRADQDKYPKLAMRYKNYGRPATVVYNSAGAEVIKRRGYLEPQIMFWMLDTVAANPDPEAHR